MKILINKIIEFFSGKNININNYQSNNKLKNSSMTINNSTNEKGKK